MRLVLPLALAALQLPDTANVGSGVSRLCTRLGTPGLSPGSGLWRVPNLALWNPRAQGSGTL